MSYLFQYLNHVEPGVEDDPLTLRGEVVRREIYRRLPSGSQMIYILKGDITVEQIDAYVSPTDPGISMAGGLSAILSKKGGEPFVTGVRQFTRNYSQLQPTQAVATIGGHLPAKYVIHACGPSAQVPQTQFVSFIKSTISNSLSCASVNGNIKSVSVPAISAGTQGRSPASVTQLVTKAVCEWLDANPNSCVKKIVFVGIEQDVIDGFKTALQSIMAENATGQ